MPDFPRARGQLHRLTRVRAAQLDPEGAWARAELEDRMGHRFRQDLSMLDIIELAEQAGPVDASGAGCQVEDWAA